MQWHANKKNPSKIQVFKAPNNKHNVALTRTFRIEYTTQTLVGKHCDEVITIEFSKKGSNA